MKSIKTKIWMGMMILVAAIIILLWLFQIIFLYRFYTVLEIGEVKNNAETIVSEIEKLSELDQIKNQDSILANIEKYIYEKQLSLKIIDKDYKVIYQASSGNNTNMPAVIQETWSEISKNAIAGEKSQQEVTHPKYGYDFMIIGVPINKNNLVEAAMIITMPMAPIGETVDILKSQLIIITGVLLLISLLLSYKLSKNLANPISEIGRQADSYANGDYNIRINNISDDEIGKLAKQMNEMGEALTRSDALQKELIANVSHELRTPLTLIRGYAETLHDVTGANPEKRDKQLGIIIEESERLGNMVEDILNLSRIQSGATTLEMDKFSLYKMLISIKEHFELDEKGRRIDLVGVSESDEKLIGDKQKIQQVFYNIITNAFRHSEQGKPIVVEVINNKKTVRIEIIDQGKGISDVDIEHIFERYYKGTDIDGKRSSGTGLGLAIVKSILDIHKAPYGVASELGKGTVFWFELKKEDSHTSF